VGLVIGHPDAPLFSAEGVAGVYVGLERSLRATGEFTYDVTEVVLFPDGQFRRNGLPRRGLDEDPSLDRDQFGEMFWGRWEQSGDEVIATASNTAYRFTVTPEGLQQEQGPIWERLPPMPLTSLDGVYAREDFRDPDAPRVQFGANGAFEERGGFFAMVGSLGSFVEPDGEHASEMSAAESDLLISPGRGDYTLRNFSLTLRYTDGRVARHAFYVPPAPENSAGPPFRLLVIGSYLLARD